MNLIAHVEIPVADIARGIRFYGAVFEIQFGEIVEIHESRMAYFPFQEGKDGASGELAQGEADVPTRHGAIVYFSVGDIDDPWQGPSVAGAKSSSPKPRSTKTSSLPNSPTAKEIVSPCNRAEPCGASVANDLSVTSAGRSKAMIVQPDDWKRQPFGDVTSIPLSNRLHRVKRILNKVLRCRVASATSFLDFLSTSFSPANSSCAGSTVVSPVDMQSPHDGFSQGRSSYVQDAVSMSRDGIDGMTLPTSTAGTPSISVRLGC
ncbi:hypothetical protein SAMN03159496_05144 [Rhizobium sp. NFR07]|uniref:VOC family protein n=1 Tax=Rhizobium sp. NFR07 TaxID=1566262 RepID=UPI0008E650A9|nr:VOC family protein [Rhizobium sp. NFR07]SFB56312.1 hypothetical protein SAMN03159496_05144 [Rhizobium sp. NFR07]